MKNLYIYISLRHAYVMQLISVDEITIIYVRACNYLMGLFALERNGEIYLQWNVFETIHLNHR